MHGAERVDPAGAGYRCYAEDLRVPPNEGTAVGPNDGSNNDKKR